MKDVQVHRGWLEGWAAKASAVTAILTMVFLLRPQWKPSDKPDQITPSLPPPRVSEEPPSDLAGAAIRAVLRDDHAASDNANVELVEVRAKLDAMGWGSEDSPRADLIAVLQGLQEYQAAVAKVEAATAKQVQTMRRLVLAGTPPAFRNAYLGHIEAWHERVSRLHEVPLALKAVQVELNRLLQAADRAAAERSRNRVDSSKKYLEESVQRAESSARIIATWNDVREAALAAGVDPTPYESD